MTRRKQRQQEPRTIRGYVVIESTNEVDEAATWCGRCGKCDAAEGSLVAVNLDGPCFATVCQECNDIELWDK